MSKNCIKCGILQPLSEFYKTKGNKTGTLNMCRSCSRKYALDYIRKIGPKKMRENRMKSRYGVTQQEFDAMLHNQNGRCEICVSDITSPGKAYIDHDHKTNKVRGLLCRRCNLGLGHFQDSEWFLDVAKGYLEFFREHGQHKTLKQLYVDEVVS